MTPTSAKRRTMTTKLSRRGFLFRGITEPAPAPPDAWDDYFDSYEQACAQVNEAKPFLAEEALRLGIATEGRTDLEVLKDVFRSTGRPRG